LQKYFIKFKKYKLFAPQSYRGIKECTNVDKGEQKQCCRKATKVSFCMISLKFFSVGSDETFCTALYCHTKDLFAVKASAFVVRERIFKKPNGSI
jgi:hypothetical protein